MLPQHYHDKYATLEDWFDHFRISLPTQEALRVLGVMLISDFYLLFDEDILQHLKQQVSSAEYNRLIAVLEDVDAEANSSASEESKASSPGINPIASPFDDDDLPRIGDFNLSSSLSFRCRDNRTPSIHSPPPLSLTPFAEIQNSNHLCNVLPQKDNGDPIAPELELKSHKEAELYRIALPITKLSTNSIMRASVFDTESVDICFVVDCSGSMGCFLDSIVQNIDGFVNSMCKGRANIILRLAFIGYRDFCDDVRLVLQPFTESVSTFKSIIARQTAYGGGDDAEDVIGALKLASALQWRAATRILYLVGDSPCHGREFHSSKITDFYPEGDPHGYSIEDILKKLRSDNIRMLFGKIDGERTDIMIRQFNELAGKPAPYIFEIPVTAKNVVDMLSKKFDTLQERADMLVSVFGQAGSNQSASLDPVGLSLPRTLKSEQVIRYSLVSEPASVGELLIVERDVGTGDFPDRMMYELKVDDTVPLVKGNWFNLFRGVICENTEADLWRNVVLKEFNSRKMKRTPTKSYYDSIMARYRAARFLSDLFNTQCPRAFPRIQYTDVSIVQLCERWPEQPYMICEDYLPGHFERFSNSSGYVAPNPTSVGTNHDAVQAFSHFTYQITNRSLVVVGGQGVFHADQNTFLLTDPTIHCANDAKRFGKTNSTKRGVAKFFATHVCNGCCHALGLSSPLSSEL